MNQKTVLAPVLAIMGILTLISCATNPALLTESLEFDGSEGYVSFYSPDLTLVITPVIDGEPGRTIKNADWWSRKKDFRIACPPGIHEFIVKHKKYEERFIVTVKPGRVSFIGFRMQIDTIDSYTTRNYGSGGGMNTTTTTTYYVRSTTSRATLPVESEALDVQTAISALSAPDWGIRQVTLKMLKNFEFPDTPEKDELINLVERIYTEDPIWMVRKSAKNLLNRKGIPRPELPLFLDSFESEVGELWKSGEENGAAYSIAPGGYRVSAPKGGGAWSMRDISWVLKDMETYRLVAECIWIDGSDANAFGLCFGESEDDFTVFCLSQNGGVVAGTYRGGIWNEFLVEWNQTASEEIKGRSNHRIEVGRDGNLWTFNVDGVPVAEITGIDWEMPGEIGCYVSGPQTIDFRVIAVY